MDAKQEVITIRLSRVKRILKKYNIDHLSILDQLCKASKKKQVKCTPDNIIIGEEVKISKATNTLWAGFGIIEEIHFSQGVAIVRMTSGAYSGQTGGFDLSSLIKVRKANG